MELKASAVRIEVRLHERELLAGGKANDTARLPVDLAWRHSVGIYTAGPAGPHSCMSTSWPRP